MKTGVLKETSIANAVPKIMIANSGDYHLNGDRYKTSELRQSSNFDLIPLSEVCNILNGFAFLSSQYTDTGIRVLRITNVQKGKIVDDAPKFYPLASKDDVKNYLLVENDILMSLTGNVGRVGMLPKELLPAALNQRVACLRPKHKDKLINKYIFYLLNQDFFERDCIESANGIAQKNLSTVWLGKYEIPLPPLSIQEEIVDELNVYQKIIDSAKAVVDNYKPHIEIDPTWDMVELGDVCEIKAGGTPLRSTREFWDGDIPWYSSGELNATYTENPNEYITKEGLKGSNATLFPKGSLLIGMYDTAAFKMSILDRDATFNQAVCGVKPNDEMDPYFLMLFFMMNKEEYLRHRVGVRQRNLNKGFISEIKVPKISQLTLNIPWKNFS